MMRNRKRIGIYLNGNDRIKIKSLENSICGNVQTPYIIVDARETTKVDSSTYRASGSIGPRQIVAINNVRFSVTNYPQINYLLEQGKFDNLTAIDDQGEIISEPKSFQLYQNYPNPFNPSTTISFSIPTLPSSSHLRKGRNEEGFVTLIVYDILGRKIATILNEEINPGYYELAFNGSNLSSGTYFYKLSTPNYSETKSMVLLK
jgi:hypothetical protein